jgi:hypothetical protein
MTGAATPRARLGIARSWRDAWRIAESNPLLLLTGLGLLAATVEACAQSTGALASIPVPETYGYAVAWLVYCAMLVLNYALIAAVTAGIALVMLVKADPGQVHAQDLSRSLIIRYFLRVIAGWLSILAATWAAGFSVNVTTQIFVPALQAPTLQPAINIGSAIAFALLQAGFASLLFLRLPETLSGARRTLLPGERGRFFLLYATSFLATGLTVGLAWAFWASDLPYAAGTRLIDGKIALDGMLVVLLSFAAHRQLAAPHPAVASIFD